MDIADSVVVVTGASSGIGRATALELGRRGARTVLVARRAAELDALAAQIERETGTAALAAPADITDPAAVEAVVEKALARFGRVDGLVNSAAVTGFGALLDTPQDEVRRTLEVNVLGAVATIRATLPHMLANRRGVIVNVSSILGVVAPPLSAPYAMSKFALRALGVSLREELRLAGARGVAVSTVLPAAIDTPVYAAAYNRTGRRLQPPPPVYCAERVARDIVRVLQRPRPERISGGLLGRLFVLQHKLTPRTAERLMALDVQWALRHRADGADGCGGTDDPGTLFEPSPAAGRIDGGWHGRRRERTRLALAVLAGGTGAALALLRARAAGRTAV